MKKIGIITTSCGKSGTYGCNYGAALQGYALVRQLRDMGYDAYDFNYLSDYEYRPQQYGVVKRTVKRMKVLFQPGQIRGKLEQIRNRDNNKKNFLAFEKFVKENKLTYENGRFYSLQELRSESKTCHAFITGSDVVWNPYLHRDVNDPGYFLDFAEPYVKRISYAASFGVTVLPDESKKTLKAFLDKFDAIGVREKSGADLIKKETGLEVPVVLDPTLLLQPEKYNDIERTVTDLPKKYIAVYKFGNISHTEDKIKELSKKLGLPVVYIPSGRTSEYDVRYDVGPGEFIHIIKKAELVLSDSFHCTVFCLIGHTPFLTFYRTVPLHGKDLNSRMTDLLAMVGLPKRMVKPGKEIDYSNLFTIDFNSADRKIKKMREESLAYLRNALGE